MDTTEWLNMYTERGRLLKFLPSHKLDRTQIIDDAINDITAHAVKLRGLKRHPAKRMSEICEIFELCLVILQRVSRDVCGDCDTAPKSQYRTYKTQKDDIEQEDHVQQKHKRAETGEAISDTPIQSKKQKPTPSAIPPADESVFETVLFYNIPQLGKRRQTTPEPVSPQSPSRTLLLLSKHHAISF